jgi:hypothetical protein
MDDRSLDITLEWIKIFEDMDLVTKITNKELTLTRTKKCINLSRFLRDAVHISRDRYIARHRDRSTTLLIIFREKKLNNTLSALYRETRNAQ